MCDPFTGHRIHILPFLGNNWIKITNAFYINGVLNVKSIGNFNNRCLSIDGKGKVLV